YGRWMALAALLGFFTVASSILLLANSAFIIASAALRPPLAELQIAIVGVRFFGIARGVFRYLERYVSHEVTFRLLARLRVWFYTALEPLAPARLMDYRGGDLLARVVADIETLQNFFGRVIAPPAVALLTGLMMLAFMGHYHLALAGAILLFLALGGVAIPALTVLLARRPGRALITTRGELNAALLDGVQGAAEIIAFGAQERHLASVRALNARLAAEQRRMAWTAALSDALGVLVSNSAVIIMLVVAIPLAAQARLTGVDLAVIALATLASFEAVLPLSLAALHLGSNLEAARRLFEIVDAAPAVVDPPVPAAIPTEAGLSFRDVRFVYPAALPLRHEGEGDRGDEGLSPALDGVTFDVPPGARVAVVGPSGAGKSTLAHLLLRFWDAADGQICIGGRDIRDMAADEVRARIGVVAQNTHLFNTTFRENLLLARRAATPAEIEAAARAAHIHDFIMAQPAGYDTWIGEMGARLSGGERQRLAIARAILKDAPILLLDEPTANLDAATEAGVMGALLDLMTGRTALMITHRLVSMDAFDRILVLDRGRIVEHGAHAELLAAKGLYRRLWDLQRERLAEDRA
ncbi:MAG: thiol reductant ABC exporter subunit CydC, partial [Anaerolineae bacterium]|nr:thiol reductant ABC exporter subunit CydC [Anaerolineae bacterium]